MWPRALPSSLGLCWRCLVFVFLPRVEDIPDFVSKDSRNRGHRGRGVRVAYFVFNQQVSYFPSEHAWIKSLIAPDLVNNLWSGHSRLGAANGAGQNGACVVVPLENFGDAAMTDTQPSRDITRTRSFPRHFNDLSSRVVREWPTVHEVTTQLVHLSASI